MQNRRFMSEEAGMELYESGVDDDLRDPTYLRKVRYSWVRNLSLSV